jgi:hypothetical protein
LSAVAFQRDAHATHANRYAVVFESNFADYTGIQGDIWTGAPNPVPAGTFSNQTLWATRNNLCYNNPVPGKSWIETGWTKKGTAPLIYKLIHKLPGWNCAYIEENLGLGGPVYNSTHSYKLECTTCFNANWFLTLDAIQWGLYTGWGNPATVTYLNAGGEVGGHYTGIGMQGAVNNLKYKRGSTWYTWTNATGDDLPPFSIPLINTVLPGPAA